jgi:hypothetical protein
MALVHTLLPWGCIVGVTLLGCPVGCHPKEGFVVRPSVPYVQKESAPASTPQTPRPQTPNAAPAGKPATIQIGIASWYGPGFHGRETARGETFNAHTNWTGDYDKMLYQ